MFPINSYFILMMKYQYIKKNQYMFSIWDTMTVDFCMTKLVGSCKLTETNYVTYVIITCGLLPLLIYSCNRSKSVFIEPSFKTLIPTDTAISTGLWVDIFIPPTMKLWSIIYPGFILFIHRQSICHPSICHLSVIVQTITQILLFGFQPFYYMYHSNKNLAWDWI